MDRQDIRQTEQTFPASKRPCICICGILLIAGVVTDAINSHAAIQRDEREGSSRREIADPCLRKRWQLIANPLHPGWPGRLSLLDDDADKPDKRIKARLPDSVIDMQLTVIQMGDRVTVEQDSDILHGRFMAVALESARTGGKLRVRLIVSGGRSPAPVIPVVATGIGLVRWFGTEEITRQVATPLKERTGR